MQAQLMTGNGMSESADAPAARVYSPLVRWVASALGGPFAALAMVWLDIRGLRRQQEDRRRWALALALAVASVVACAVIAARAFAADATPIREVSGYVLRGLGLAICGAFQLRHRRFFQSPAVTRVSGVHAWGLSVPLILASLFLQIAITDVAALLARLSR